MTLTDYLINIVLISLVILQIRGSRLDTRTAIRPVILVAVAAAYYLRAFPTAGNDVTLYAVLGGIGLVLGIGCGATTRVFSIAHDNAWVAALILMALAAVISRLIVIRIRGARTRQTGEALTAARRQTVAA